MTPLEIRILLDIYTTPGPLPGNGQAGAEALRRFVREGLIDISVESRESILFELTPSGLQYIDRLLRVEPVEVSVSPLEVEGCQPCDGRR